MECRGKGQDRKKEMGKTFESGHKVELTDSKHERGVKFCVACLHIYCFTLKSVAVGHVLSLLPVPSFGSPVVDS